MIERQIKGRITPYTPYSATRWVDVAELGLSPDDIAGANVTAYGTMLDIKVNGRVCCLYLYKQPIPSTCLLSVRDTPLPPRKPPKNERIANEVFMNFCQSGQWKELLREWESRRHRYFRGALLKQLESLKMEKDSCGECHLRFVCLTERRQC